MVEVSKLAREGMLQPKEALWAKGRKKDQLTIGIPKENSYQENRVPLTPLSVGLLVENGHQVLLESGAGEASNFLDHHYSEQGAQIVYNKQEVYQCDLIIKIASPTLQEVDLMRSRQVLFSSQQPSLMNREVLSALDEEADNCFVVRVFRRRRRTSVCGPGDE